jgi:hypothetical protein
MSLRSPTDNESANFVMPAWIAGIQVRKDASGNIRVNLDSSTPCWNDAIEGPLLKVTEVLLPHIFDGGARRKKNLAAKSSNDAKDVGAGFKPALLRGLIKVLSLENKKGESL